jgi:hypothetical protein
VCHIAQGLLQSVRIDALNLATMLSREIFNFTHTRIVSPISKPDHYHTLRMSLEKHPYRVHAVDRLSAFQVPSTRDVFHQIQIDEALNRIHRCHNDPDVSAGPQSSASAATRPSMPVVFHYVFVVAEIIEVKQPIHRDIQYLHETPKLHHRCDDAVESLANSLT